MSAKPIINISEIELQPRPAAFAAKGAATARYDARMGAIGPRVGAQKLGYNINTGTEKLRYLAVSTKLSPEIAEYPDSGKFGVLAEFSPGLDGKPQMFRFVGRENLSVDYWDGE